MEEILKKIRETIKYLVALTAIQQMLESGAYTASSNDKPFTGEALSRGISTAKTTLMHLLTELKMRQQTAWNFENVVDVVDVHRPSLVTRLTTPRSEFTDAVQAASNVILMQALFQQKVPIMLRENVVPDSQLTSAFDAAFAQMHGLFTTRMLAEHVSEDLLTHMLVAVLTVTPHAGVSLLGKVIDSVAAISDETCSRTA